MDRDPSSLDVTNFEQIILAEHVYLIIKLYNQYT